MEGSAITVAESGCGATCVSMVIGYFEPHREPEPDEIMRLAGEMGFYRGDGWGAMRFACCWRSMALRAAGARWMRGQSKYAAQGAADYRIRGAGVFHRKRALCRFCAALAANGELLVADPNSEENTLHKTYRFAEMLRQAKGDYPFMICDQIDAPEERRPERQKP